MYFNISFVIRHRQKFCGQKLKKLQFGGGHMMKIRTFWVTFSRSGQVT